MTDSVVPIIGVLVKEWAKKNGFHGNDYPSSYGWILMVIHYLQKVDVIPYLWELQRKISKSTGTVYQYFDDIPNLDKYFVSINCDSLTALLIGFFDYWCKFDFNNIIFAREITCRVQLKYSDSGLVRHPIAGRSGKSRYEFIKPISVVSALQAALHDIEVMSGKQIVEYIS